MLCPGVTASFQVFFPADAVRKLTVSYLAV